MAPTVWKRSDDGSDLANEDICRPPVANFALGLGVVKPPGGDVVNDMLKASVELEGNRRRMMAVSHSGVDLPLCAECRSLEMNFFDPSACSNCLDELRSVGHVFAAFRQWVPQTQQSVETLLEVALKKGAHPDDRDSVTDMTLLMYVCKAGAVGVGNPPAAAKCVQKLISLGATLSLRCKWTDMTGLHYAAFFDAAPVLAVLLNSTKGSDVDDTCAEHENGTALHIGTANLALDACKVLLGFGADPNLEDDLARTPIDCVPEDDDEFANDSLSPPTVFACGALSQDEVQLRKQKIRLLFSRGLAGFQQIIGGYNHYGSLHEEYPAIPVRDSERMGGSSPVVSSRAVMQALGLKLGDRVLVDGDKMGSLQYCGTAQFAPGTWLGVVLDEAKGRNDGSLDGVSYFRCRPGYGLLVSPHKVSKVGKNYRSKSPGTGRTRSKIINHGKVDVSRIGSRFAEAMNVIAEKGTSEIRVGDRVQVLGLDIGLLPGCREPSGTVRFVGCVDFVDDDSRWYGVELDDALGRHDGTVQGVRYFSACDNHGVFVTESKLLKTSASNKGCIGNLELSTDSRESLLDRKEETFSMNYHLLSSTQVSLLDEEVITSERRRSSLSAKHRASKVEVVRDPAVDDLSPLSSARRQLQPNNPSFPVMQSKMALASSPGPCSIPSLSLSKCDRGKKRSNVVVATNKNLESHSVDRRGPGWQTVAVVESAKFTQQKKTPAKKYLEVGSSVICIHSKEMGTVKYIGRVSFADGIWLGLELRNPRAGRHDGVVGGRRYFSAGIDKGVMVRPKLVSVHGINGADLIKPESEYPF